MITENQAIEILIKVDLENFTDFSIRISLEQIVIHKST